MINGLHIHILYAVISLALPALISANMAANMCDFERAIPGRVRHKRLMHSDWAGDMLPNMCDRCRITKWSPQHSMCDG